MEATMGFFSKLLKSFKTANPAKSSSGNMQKDTGAGPALAAHSKDAKASGKAGQNASAATKKR
ncbi:hypothetical protein CIT25_29215 [Mesorhizobium mediterraneum]|jgi:hypothetical protein|uniref:Uncharacterized protein n=2 Tax=Phyllobacteriaceae TaxID=69277 RepID=A0AB36R238_9HYPH|nr:hypothetical protein CIT25_29215 [Mesorhizobium mediterraneum]